MGEKNLNKDFTNTRRGGGVTILRKFFSKFLFLNDGFPYIKLGGTLLIMAGCLGYFWERESVYSLITFDCSVYVRFYDAWKYLQINCLIYEVLASYCSRRRNLDFKLWMTGIAKSQNNYSNMWHNNRCTFDVCKIGQLGGSVGNDKENRNTHLGLTCLLKDS